MSPEQMAEERRDALADMAELERTATCGHTRLNRAGNCYDCDARAEEIQ